MSEVHIVTVEGPQWLNANRDKGHWGPRHKVAQQWKANARWAARAARLPRFSRRVRIDAFLIFPRNHRRDPSNWHPTLKPIIDGLTDETVKVGRTSYRVTGPLVDDDHEHVDGPHIDIRICSGVRVPTVELHISEVG